MDGSRDGIRLVLTVIFTVMKMGLMMVLSSQNYAYLNEFCGWSFYSYVVFVIDSLIIALYPLQVIE